MIRSHQQCGFSYIEVVIASFILAISLVPAIDGLQSGLSAGNIHQQILSQQQALDSHFDEVLSQPWSVLIDAAATAGNKTTATVLSSSVDPVINVYIALYDADADPFTLIDDDADGDANLFTGNTARLLWIRAELAGTDLYLETLQTP